MLFRKTLNHIKLFKSYDPPNNSTILSGGSHKRTYNTMIESDIEYNYKKQKQNSRYQTHSSYIETSNIDISKKQLQKIYDISVIKTKLDKSLIDKPDGYRRDGILFEKVLGIIYENEGYNIRLTGGTNDAGVDLIALKDNKKIAIQAKNFNDNMTSKYLNKGHIETIFNKIKNNGESKHLEIGETFHSARLHIYNDNIVSMRPQYMEQIAIKHGYDIYDKGIYGKTWLLNYINRLNDESINKFYTLLE